MQNQFEWNDLDADDETWNRLVKTPEVPIVVGRLSLSAPQSGKSSAADEFERDTTRFQFVWHPALGAAVVIASVVTLIACGVWRMAQQGMAKIEADVANVIRLETLRAQAKHSIPDTLETIENVEVLGDAAIVEILVTQRQAAQVSQFRNLRFYVHSVAGWQRSEPLASFWGPISNLGTEHVHIVFRERDRILAEQLSSSAEILYVGLVQVFDPELTRSGTLTIEIVPRFVEGLVRYGDDQIQITSPLLYYPTFGMSSSEYVTGMLGDVMCSPLHSAVFQSKRFKLQWQPLMKQMDCQLITDAILDRGKNDGGIEHGSSASTVPHVVELKDLLDSSWQTRSALQPGTVVRHQGFGEVVQRARSETAPKQPRNANYRNVLIVELPEPSPWASTMIRYLIASYGTECLPRLIDGFGVYEDWETLAPAVFGISASQLEADWHGAPD